MTDRFELLRETRIEESNSLVQLYRHKKTGARIMSVINDDENKVFGITFRTPPHDSTGVPHIMEHSVLCGSRKYPLKEPFIELVKGSLNTFLNAMTYPDKTIYPVASQNEQDLYNLIDVYLDAVFHPLLPPETLQQEGWHYELEHPEDNLSIKGIVYNEMKGVYSNPDSLLYRNLQQWMFPNHTYGVDSGGDPLDIPKLTYEQFRAFHKNYYHPSNSWIFFYGDDNPARRFAILEEYLEEFEAQDVDSSIPLYPPFSEPVRRHAYYDSDEDGEEAKKTMFVLSWMLPELDTEVDMALNILSYMLVSTPASPLRKILLDSNLGEEVIGGGLSDELRNATFSVGLKGIKAADAPQVEALILSTLKKLAEEGFQPELLEAALNTLEFNLRENNTGSFPRGLDMMLEALCYWLYDRDPIAAISFKEPLERVKHKLATDSRWLQNLIQTYVLDNPHLVIATLEPKRGLRTQEEATELERLQNLQASLSATEIETIVASTHALQEAQEKPDSPELLALLPTLKLADLEREGKEYQTDITHHQGTEILYHDLFTNGVLYLDVCFDLQTLPQAWIPYLPLFGHALIEIGTQTENDVQLAQRIRSKTGGIWTTTLNSAKAHDPQGTTNMILRGKSTLAQSQDLLDIIRDILLTVKFDNRDRFKQMVLRSKAHRESSLLPSGHGIVGSRIRSHFDTSSWVSEQMGGLEQLFFVRKLAQQIESDWPSVLSILESIRERLLNRNQMLCNVTVDSPSWTTFQPQLQQWLELFPTRPKYREVWTPQPLPTHEGLAISAQVNYVGKGANLYDYGYNYHASVAVITKYLNTSWLWEKVRMQGGAYGGMCGFSRLTGVFNYLSYRDPNLLDTLHIYDASGEFLRKLDISHEELSRTIIGTIGDIDTYRLPDAKGYTAMIRHILEESPELRQELREQILNTNLQHFHDFANALDAVRDHGHVVVMGARSTLEQNQPTLPPTLTLTDVQN